MSDRTSQKSLKSAEPTKAPRMSDYLGRYSAAPDEKTPVASFSKAEHVYAILRREILDGIHPPGSWLRLSTLATRLSLSAMPVREALRLLEKDGLVVVHLHRGAQVASLSFEFALEVTEVRMQLERHGAISALPMHTQMSIAETEQALRSLQSTLDDPVQFALLNRAFSTAVIEPCPNGFLKQHVQRLWDQNWQYSSTAVFEVMRHRIVDSLAENIDILACIKNGDQDGLMVTYDRRLGQSVKAWRAAIERNKISGIAATSA